jgi:dethiobiotin synthetase
LGRGFFVTGTDTGVGKTAVASGLLHAFSKSGKSVVGMKPVASGSEAGRWTDADSLAAESSVHVDPRLVCPYAFDPAIAPHIAAQLAGARIDLDVIFRAYEALSLAAEVVVVEGIGGLLVPLNERQTGADLAVGLRLPVVLVVGMRLGCLNHALLTRREIGRCGLRCAGWVADCILPDVPQLDANIKALQERLDCPLLGVVPFFGKPDAAYVASKLSIGALA